MNYQRYQDLEQTKRTRIDRMDHFQPIIVTRKHRKFPWFLVLLPIIVLIVIYFFTPVSTRILVLGIDETPPGSYVGRSDTILILKLQPAILKTTMVSIPRDLWVPIEGYGENRINTAHFFAELESPGSGAKKALHTINTLFDLDLHYYVRFSFEGFKQVIDSLGGVSISLDQQTAGLPPGNYHLNGTQALEFVRERKSADDFYRMKNAQLFMVAFVRELIKPASIQYYPAIIRSSFFFIDTNIPVWQYPRLALSGLLGIITGPDMSTIDRSMVTPYTTSEGASVLLPEWSLINPYLHKLIK